MTGLDRVRGHISNALFRSLFVCALTLGAAGCATDRYYAANLPMEWQAPPIENSQTIDLSGIAADAISDDVIDRGDVLEVSIATGVSEEQPYTFNARVDESTGYADLPLVGRVHLLGLDLAGAEAEITVAAIRQDLYRAPHVTVTMKTPKMHRIMVVGAVNKPGVHQLRPANCNLLQAIVQAEELADDAGAMVVIRNPNDRDAGILPSNRVASRGKQDVVGAGYAVPFANGAAEGPIRVNLVTATELGRSYDLEDGAVVMVEKRDPMPIFVSGLVKKPNRYDYPVGEELRVVDAIAVAGGISSSLADKVFVIRRMPGRPDPALIQLSLREAKRNGDVDLRLMPGDKVIVERTFGTALLEAINVIRFGISATPLL